MIETNNLNFGFSKTNLLLKDINLRVERGAIYGFLGPNGAGKTTMIRLLLGLLPDKEDRIRLFGEPLKDNRTAILSKIGCLIEQPSLYEHISGFDNLEIARKIRNGKREQIDKVLEWVGLTRARHLQVSKYSLGMKQRLGLAIALLTSPDLLILDEPVNGMDPEGMVEMRQLLLRLNKESGVTIFLSSHLLPEIEKLVTHLGILHKGNLVFQGRLAELEAHQRKRGLVVIETNDNQRGLAILKEPFPLSFIEGDRITIPFQNKEQTALICKRLISDGIDIYDLRVLNSDLETLFLDLIKN